MYLIGRADFGLTSGSDYVLLFDRPEDHIAALAGLGGVPVEIDLRPRLDPDEVALLETLAESAGQAYVRVENSRLRALLGSAIQPSAS